ncbi:hypothetical protein [Spirosoma utsteinense]|uniref:Uncharacterized protein n=1 Tax=Spirosoma utsteinense TaxID=2585773 RepID=A0ABR6WEE4_9BACT|nr:hypothetical protein [Spirosoma utsteinense]MBC3787993.1 hypothetical protein [Spirosoma utsteinense]MBC3794930.1 hypothetical protein [Spirosoma utsteinense]
MKTLDYVVAAAYVATNGLAIVQVIGAHRWPVITRLLFFLIFAMAAVVNTRTVLDTPWVYQSYAYYALPLYSWFILGPFDAITQPMVLTIAVGQALISIAMFTSGRWFRVGCFGGILFCLVIAPLGLGAAFPATLLLALAFYRLSKHEDRQPVGKALDKRRVSSTVA